MSWIIGLLLVNSTLAADPGGSQDASVARERQECASWFAAALETLTPIDAARRLGVPEDVLESSEDRVTDVLSLGLGRSTFHLVRVDYDLEAAFAILERESGKAIRLIHTIEVRPNAQFRGVRTYGSGLLFEFSYRAGSGTGYYRDRKAVVIVKRTGESVTLDFPYRQYFEDPVSARAREFTTDIFIRDDPSREMPDVVVEVRFDGEDAPTSDVTYRWSKECGCMRPLAGHEIDEVIDERLSVD